MKSFLLNKIANYPHLIPMAILSPIMLIKLFFILFNTSSGFVFQFEACIIYLFHAQFVFDIVLDVLIVVYTPRVYLIKVKAKHLLVFLCKSITIL